MANLEKIERNKQIYSNFISGKTIINIMKEHGFSSRGTVAKILARWRQKAQKRERPHLSTEKN